MKKYAVNTILIVLATLAIGCSKSSNEKTLNNKDFINKVNSICKQTAKSTDKLPKVNIQDLSKLPASFTNQAKVQEKQIESLKKLNLNDKQSKVINKAIDLTQQKVDTLNEIAKIIKNGKNDRQKISSQLVKPLNKIKNANLKLQILARNAKFFGCVSPIDSLKKSSTTTTQPKETTTTAK